MSRVGLLLALSLIVLATAHAIPQTLEPICGFRQAIEDNDSFIVKNRCHNISIAKDLSLISWFNGRNTYRLHNWSLDERNSSLQMVKDINLSNYHNYSFDKDKLILYYTKGELRFDYGHHSFKYGVNITDFPFAHADNNLYFYASVLYADLKELNLTDLNKATLKDDSRFEFDAPIVDGVTQNHSFQIVSLSDRALIGQKLGNGYNIYLDPTLSTDSDSGSINGDLSVTDTSSPYDNLVSDLADPTVDIHSVLKWNTTAIQNSVLKWANVTLPSSVTTGDFGTNNGMYGIFYFRNITEYGSVSGDDYTIEGDTGTTVKTVCIYKTTNNCPVDYTDVNSGGSVNWGTHSITESLQVFGDNSLNATYGMYNDFGNSVGGNDRFGGPSGNAVTLTYTITYELNNPIQVSSITYPENVSYDKDADDFWINFTYSEDDSDTINFTFILEQSNGTNYTLGNSATENQSFNVSTYPDALYRIYIQSNDSWDGSVNDSLGEELVYNTTEYFTLLGDADSPSISTITERTCYQQDQNYTSDGLTWLQTDNEGITESWVIWQSPSDENETVSASSTDNNTVVSVYFAPNSTGTYNYFILVNDSSNNLATTQGDVEVQSDTCTVQSGGGGGGGGGSGPATTVTSIQTARFTAFVTQPIIFGIFNIFQVFLAIIFIALWRTGALEAFLRQVGVPGIGKQRTRRGRK